MFDEMFDALGDNPKFQEVIKNIIDKMVLDVNNDLKLKKIDLNEDIVKATLLICINNTTSFDFMRTINLVMNGADEVAFGNVNEFLYNLENIYVLGEELKEAHVNSEKY